MRVADVQDLQRELAAAAEALAAEKAARREEAAAAAAEIAQLSERLTAAEQAPRHSDMSDSPDISAEPSYATAPETRQGAEPDLEQAQAPCPPLAGRTTLFARGLGWQGELMGITVQHSPISRGEARWACVRVAAHTQDTELPI